MRGRHSRSRWPILWGRSGSFMAVRASVFVKARELIGRPERLNIW